MQVYYFRFMVFIGSYALVQYCEIHLSHRPIILCFFISVCTLLNVYRLIVCTLYGKVCYICASVMNI
jgi:hypothetical protein